MFLFRSVFWLGLALFIIQPHGTDLAGPASRLGAAAVETGRAAALDGLGQVACDSLQCAGVKLIAQTALATPTPSEDIVTSAPYPAPPLIRRAS